MHTPTQNGHFVEHVVELPSRTKEKEKLRSQIRSLERDLSEIPLAGLSRATVDKRSTELALKSARLVLETIETNEKAIRANNRKGKDARKLRRSSH